MKVQAAMTIRARKLGLLIKDARLASRRTVPECAEAINVSPGVFRSYEAGTKSPSLPELEALSYFFQIPIQRFWSREAISDDASPTSSINLTTLIPLRHRMIGALLRQKRMDASLSIRSLADETGISPSRLASYELGEKVIPVPELESCLVVLGSRIELFFDQRGPVGQWLSQQQAIQEFLKLPPEMQAFVCRPVNRPYLDLARNLSQLSTEKMRSIAEGLLDITL